jgi:hypothetical protein
MSGLRHHPPDLCWVGVGWTPENLGQPDNIILSFEGATFL